MLYKEFLKLEIYSWKKFILLEVAFKYFIKQMGNVCGGLFNPASVYIAGKTNQGQHVVVKEELLVSHNQSFPFIFSHDLNIHLQSCFPFHSHLPGTGPQIIIYSVRITTETP